MATMMTGSRGSLASYKIFRQFNCDENLRSKIDGGVGEKENDQIPTITKQRESMIERAVIKIKIKMFVFALDIFFNRDICWRS